jgi:hypothetical protein
MKRIIWNITLASVIALAAYIALYAILGAIMNSIENRTVALSLLALATTMAFGGILIYVAKIRRSVGEDEVMDDYADTKYLSFADDFKRIIRREAKTLICMAAIVLLTFGLNTLDWMIFGKKTFSAPTIIYAPLCLFSSALGDSFIGYLVSALMDCIVYIIFLLLYRKKKYNYWMTNNL